MKVGIIGYGITPFTLENPSIESLLLQSVRDTFSNNQTVTQDDVDAVLVSTNDNSKYMGSILSEMAGIKPKIAHSVESMCNSGSNAIVSAYSYIASGLADVILVRGVPIQGRYYSGITLEARTNTPYSGHQYLPDHT